MKGGSAAAVPWGASDREQECQAPPQGWSQSLPHLSGGPCLSAEAGWRRTCGTGHVSGVHHHTHSSITAICTRQVGLHAHGTTRIHPAWAHPCCHGWRRPGDLPATLSLIGSDQHVSILHLLLAMASWKQPGHGSQAHIPHACLQACSSLGHTCRCCCISLCAAIMTRSGRCASFM